MAFIEYENRKINYIDKGEGKTVLIIHGNSVSQKMHKNLMNKLARSFRVISLDLPGHGKSERLENWPVDFWYEHAKAVNKLICDLVLDDVSLLGYSGGALVALNCGLEFPGRISKIIADSFEGTEADETFAGNVEEDRASDKKKLLARLFWRMMHGKDWEAVVDADTNMTAEHFRLIRTFFHKELKELEIPVLMTGSRGDEYISDFQKIYDDMKSKLPGSEYTIYEKGKHPACLTVGRQYIEDVTEFINS